MRVEFKKFDTYVHVYKLKGLHNSLLEYEEELSAQAISHNKDFPMSDSANFSLQNQELQNILNNSFLSIAKKHYILGSTYSLQENIGVYYQTKTQSRNYYHNHISTSSLTAVTYLNPPKEGEGGEISFYLHENHILNILPQPDLIYFFPSWLLHKPLPQTNNSPRICFNWGYSGYKNPIHKLTGDKW